MKEQVHKVDKEEFARVQGRKRFHVSIPVPTALMSVTSLEGESLSAWTTERYLVKGEAYVKHTRLWPFGGQPYVTIKVPRSRTKSIRCEVKSYKVVPVLESLGVLGREGVKSDLLRCQWDEMYGKNPYHLWDKNPWIFLVKMERLSP